MPDSVAPERSRVRTLSGRVGRLTGRVWTESRLIRLVEVAFADSDGGSAWIPDMYVFAF